MVDPKNASTAANKAAASKSEKTVTPPSAAKPVVVTRPEATAADAVAAADRIAVDGDSSVSSVGAELAPEAETFNEDGLVVLDAGGPYVAAAPRPTPAEAVAYPSTGGLPDTGPNSKYSVKDNPAPKLFNENGDRVDRDGKLIDEIGNRIPFAFTEAAKPDAKKDVPASTREEMDAGRARLARR